MTKKALTKGFTLLELLVVIAISLILLGFTIGAFYSFQSSQSVGKTANLLKSMIEKARFQTISLQNGTTYGVHFLANEAVLFQGSTYATSTASNQFLIWSPSISLSNIGLTGSTTNVTFAALTGEPSVTGVLTFTVPGNNPLQTATVTIDSSGIIE